MPLGGFCYHHSTSHIMHSVTDIRDSDCLLRYTHQWRNEWVHDNSIQTLVETLFSIGSWISHMDTHTHTHAALAVVHCKHMVKLIGLTWQQSQWCQRKSSLNPDDIITLVKVCEGWGHLPVKSVCAWERDTLPVTVKGSKGQVIQQVKLFHKTLRGNTVIS